MGDTNLPFKVDYAKTARASCKLCKTAIAKDELRLATVIQSSRFDGKMIKWFHFECFFKKHRLTSVDQIDGFSNIKYEDQKILENKLCAVDESAQKGSHAETSHFSVETANSGRSKCRVCSKLIALGQIRISKLIFNLNRGQNYGGTAGWHHVDCFISERENLGWYLAAEKLPGFSQLKVTDQELLSEKIQEIKPPNKRPQTGGDDGPPKKQNKAEDTALKKQSDLLFQLKKDLEENLVKNQLSSILTLNNMKIPAGVSAMRDCIADALAFGVCEACPECKEKAFVFNNNEYRCTGNFSEVTPCTYTTLLPGRTKIEIPPQLSEKFPFLKGNVGQRKLAPKNTEIVEPKNDVEDKKTQKTLLRVLSNTVVVIESSYADVAIVRAQLQTFGARIVKAITTNTLCVISTKENVEKLTQKVNLAKKRNVFVVSEKFLEDCDNGTVDLKKHSLADWGDENLAKTFLDAARKAAEEKIAVQSSNKSKSSRSSKSLPSDVTSVSSMMTATAEVDPSANVYSTAIIYREGDVFYNCILSRAEASQGVNSFYKMQLIDSDGIFCIYRSWGRIGTTIGGKKTDYHESLEKAREYFKSQFYEKTGNHWDDKQNFVKKPNLFDLVAMDMTIAQGESSNKFALAPNSESKLPMEVQELVCFIFDVNILEQQLKKFKIDTKKMPLGKISEDQILKAYKILTEIQDLIAKKASKLKLLDASNRFFTVIPHDFGRDAPPVIDNPDFLKEKIEMVEALKEMEFALNVIKQGPCNGEIPVDHYYKALNTKIDVLPKNSKTFGLLEKYLKTTHGRTHSGYELEILDIFTIEREGEVERFKNFEKLHNRKLLWHGSRLSNFVGIITEGLRIAPPEVPKTGYMFGKGIYFADMVSKSANYCCIPHDKSTGLLLLCDVALGDMYELTKSEFVTELPTGKHSTKGLGSVEPSKKELLDGAIVPLGPEKDVGLETGLLYNEYIVYDVSQVRIKYMLKVNFKNNY